MEKIITCKDLVSAQAEVICCHFSVTEPGLDIAANHVFKVQAVVFIIILFEVCLLQITSE